MATKLVAQLNVFYYIAKVTVSLVMRIVTQYNALLLAVLYMRPS